jgi:hypothetical protein
MWVGGRRSSEFLGHSRAAISTLGDTLYPPSPAHIRAQAGGLGLAHGHGLAHHHVLAHGRPPTGTRQRAHVRTGASRYWRGGARASQRARAGAWPRSWVGALSCTGAQDPPTGDGGCIIHSRSSVTLSLFPVLSAGNYRILRQHYFCTTCCILCDSQNHHETIHRTPSLRIWWNHPQNTFSQNEICKLYSINLAQVGR